MSGFWYLATPYSKYEAGIEQAFIDACHAAAWLIRHGVPVMSPIAHTHPIAIHGKIDPLDVELWIEADRPMMAAAKGLIVCELDGWDTSWGVSEEIDEFNGQGKPVILMRMPPSWEEMQPLLGEHDG